MGNRYVHALLVGAFIGAGIGCGDGDPSGANAGPPPGGGQPCRTYATHWITTSTAGQSGSTAAVFDSNQKAYVEYSPAGSNLAVRATWYARVADFIDEPSLVGLTLYSRRETCIAECAGYTRAVPAYDSQRRLRRLAVTGNGNALFTDSFTAWDDRGRPTAGTRLAQQCSLALSFTYDDSARRVVITVTAPAGATALCQQYSATQERTVDADGNATSETGSAGGMSTTVTHDIVETAQLCK